jgi:hypothetical protein
VIAGRPSATALLVALSVWRHGAAHGLPNEAILIAGEALAEARGIWPWLRRCAATRIGGWLLDRLESVLLPGLAEHHCRRKQWLWQALLRRSESRRWIWLGVGFDGLGRALRGQRCATDRIEPGRAEAYPSRAHLLEPGQPGTDPIDRAPIESELIELDHPDSLALRKRLPLIQSAPGIPMRSLSLPGDAASLQRLCAERPAIVVAEGLLMYLPPRPLLRLLRALARLPNPPELWLSALCLEHPDGRGFARSRGLTRAWLSAQGEPFRWRIEPERLQALLRRHGYATEQHWDGGGFGEFVLGVRRAGNRRGSAGTRPDTLCSGGPMMGCRDCAAPNSAAQTAIEHQAETNRGVR